MFLFFLQQQEQQQQQQQHKHPHTKYHKAAITPGYKLVLKKEVVEGMSRTNLNKNVNKHQKCMEKQSIFCTKRYSMT